MSVKGVDVKARLIAEEDAESEKETEKAVK